MAGHVHPRTSQDHAAVHCSFQHCKSLASLQPSLQSPDIWQVASWALFQVALGKRHATISNMLLTGAGALREDSQGAVTFLHKSAEALALHRLPKIWRVDFPVTVAVCLVPFSSKRKKQAAKPTRLTVTKGWNAWRLSTRRRVLGPRRAAVHTTHDVLGIA